MQYSHLVKSETAGIAMVTAGESVKVLDSQPVVDSAGKAVQYSQLHKSEQSLAGSAGRDRTDGESSSVQTFEPLQITHVESGERIYVNKHGNKKSDLKMLPDLPPENHIHPIDQLNEQFYATMKKDDLTEIAATSGN